MSTAKNHAKRSHRNEFRNRPYHGGRKSRIKPTVRKTGFLNWIKMIRNAKRNEKELENDYVL